MEKPMGTSALYTCLNCGKNFEDKTKERKYCSGACYGAHGRRQRKKTRKDWGTRKSAWLTLVCFCCGKEFERRASEVREQATQFCSKDCYRKTGNAVVMAKSRSKHGRPRLREGDLGFHPNAVDLIRNKPYGEPKSWSADNGYILYYWKTHPACSSGGRIHEHRAVAYALWGDAIKGMHVDHINGNKSDNRPENLQILTQKEHALKTAQKDGVAAFASWVRETYPAIYEEWSNLRS